MKQGRTMSQLAALVNEQEKVKRDFVGDTRVMEMVPQNNNLLLQIQNIGEFLMNGIFHEGVSQKLKINKPYYDRMLTEDPYLLAVNVNRWFQKTPTTNMIRTLAGNARAFMSSAYRPLDNYDLFRHALPILQQHGLQVRSSELTERKLYIKAVVPEFTREIQYSKRGDTMALGIMISNSEVGCGALSVQPFVDILICKNGMVMNGSGMRRFHIGKRQNGDDEDAREYITDETRAAEDKAIWLKCRDTVQGILSDDFANKVQRKFDESAQRSIGSPVQAVEVVRKQYTMTESEGELLMQHLIEGGDLSVWGMSNAITRMAQDVEDYDRATELEARGFDVIELPQRTWA